MVPRLKLSCGFAFALWIPFSAQVPGLALCQALGWLQGSSVPLCLVPCASAYSL